MRKGKAGAKVKVGWARGGLVALAALLAGCGGSVDVGGGTAMPVDALPGESSSSAPERSESGLQWVVLAPGEGNPPAAGQRVRVHYSGYLPDGAKFDSSVDRGEPFSFVIGRGEVIPGWDEALLLMKPGEKRKLIIPPELAYGAEGYPPAIPANATLVFDVELLGVE